MDVQDSVSGFTEPRPLGSGWESRRNKSARRARQALLWALGAFFLLQAVLIFGIDHGVPELRDVAYAQKVTRLRQRTEEAPTQPLTVVMLGSSRTVFGLKAGRLEKPLEDETG